MGHDPIGHNYPRSASVSGAGWMRPRAESGGPRGLRSVVLCMYELESRG